MNTVTLWIYILLESYFCSYLFDEITHLMLIIKLFQDSFHLKKLRGAFKIQKDFLSILLIVISYPDKTFQFSIFSQRFDREQEWIFEVCRFARTLCFASLLLEILQDWIHVSSQKTLKKLDRYLLQKKNWKDIKGNLQLILCFHLYFLEYIFFR